MSTLAADCVVIGGAGDIPIKVVPSSDSAARGLVPRMALLVALSFLLRVVAGSLPRAGQRPLRMPRTASLDHWSLATWRGRGGMVGVGACSFWMSRACRPK